MVLCEKRPEALSLPLTPILARRTYPASRGTTTEEDQAMIQQSDSPYDDTTQKTFAELTDQQLETALETAATCFAIWPQATLAQRAAVLAKAAAVMRARVDQG